MVFEHMEEKEAVEEAALIEKNGFKFYSLLSEKIKDQRIRRVLKMLLKDEKKHLKAIEGKYFPEAGFPSDEVTEEEVEIEKYVKKLGVPDIFARRINIDRLVELIDEPKKALLIALDTELHASEFFKKMAERASTEDGRRMYLKLSEEERTHAGHIEELLGEMG